MVLDLFFDLKIGLKLNFFWKYFLFILRGVLELDVLGIRKDFVSKNYQKNTIDYKTIK